MTVSPYNMGKKDKNVIIHLIKADVCSKKVARSNKLTNKLKS